MFEVYNRALCARLEIVEETDFLGNQKNINVDAFRIFHSEMCMMSSVEVREVVRTGRVGTSKGRPNYRERSRTCGA